MPARIRHNHDLVANCYAKKNISLYSFMCICIGENYTVLHRVTFLHLRERHDLWFFFLKLLTNCLLAVPNSHFNCCVGVCDRHTTK